ncbi:Claudin domain-containing protein 2 [Heterocephalus glaber]|uniref:Claudin domain-containing protein 2 n=1 Tax=Heterocephalus glaber TaxID=10181 RepID=G5BR86_HETGA|nr:Claudin domain-containing protein 2 [Heterocephalus glaber]
MGVKRNLQGWGTLLSLLANIFTILSTATNYWIRQQKGHSGVVDSVSGRTSRCGAGLQARCSSSAVSRRRVGPGCPWGSGSRAEPRARFQATVVRGRGLLLLTALTSYTAGSERKDDAFFSWSYFSGWLALPFSVLAGCCFRLADLILQSTEAIGDFPVCL